MKLINKFFFISVLIINFVALAEVTPLRDCEKWWGFKCTDPKSLEEVSNWWGNENAISRLLVRLHIINKGYKSILDIPCGLGTDFNPLKRSCPEMNYLGIDVTQLFVDKVIAQGARAMVGHIQDIPCQDSSFDVVYARHILEHLDSYKEAINEMVRVAKHEVVVVFFIKPNGTGIDRVIPVNVDGYPINHNRYSKAKMEAFLRTITKIKSFYWQEVKNRDEAILHIMVV